MTALVAADLAVLVKSMPPDTVVVGDAARVLHGRRQSCDALETKSFDLVDGPASWLPWLGAFVEQPLPLCPACGREDTDDGWAPCSCGYDWSPAAKASLQQKQETEKAAAKRLRQESAKARDLARRAGRSIKTQRRSLCLCDHSAPDMRSGHPRVLALEPKERG